MQASTTSRLVATMNDDCRPHHDPSIGRPAFDEQLIHPYGPRRADRRRDRSARARAAVAAILLSLVLAGSALLIVPGVPLPVPAGTLGWRSVALALVGCVGGPLGYTLYRHLRAVLVNHQPRHAAAAAPAAAPADPPAESPGSAQTLSLGQRLAQSMTVGGNPSPPAGGYQSWA